MNKAPRHIQHKNILRQAALILLIVSLFGPWTFDLINVPAQYPCHLPNVRLYADFCGVPLPGTLALSLVIAGFFHALWQLITGTFSGYPVQFLSGLSLFLIFPFFNTIFVMWKKDSYRPNIPALVGWGAVCGAFILISIFSFGVQILLLWGLWLYMVTAIGSLIFEFRFGGNNPVKDD